ncbi:MAG: 1-deoxy-D-xylulose-5-phosphate synthase [Actinomycetales bacterium]
MPSQLAKITGPKDLRRLSPSHLNDLAAEIRQTLIETVSATGGHLGPNLGVVELTIALHRVFTSPKDTLIFDTGHQSYVHKLLTGRQDFSRLRARGGVSGYPSRAESVHDVVESSHASASLSWADGIAKGHQLLGQSERCTVAVIGDGALTGGMAWEALNNIADGQDRRLIIVVNDNERSYAPTIGGLAYHLATLRTTQGYERFLDWGKGVLQRRGAPGRLAYEALHGMKKGIKDVVAPQGLFEDLGLKYIGPVDGHDIAAMERALKQAKDFGGPVLVHAITQKGRGYAPARNDEADQFHAVGVIDPATGKPVSASAASWTSVFGSELVSVGAHRRDVVAITAAMLIPTGLDAFAAAYPDRVFDVGIAEQHAVTSAAGMAFTGLHPVVAVYATFLTRAIDQVLMDVALHKAGVTFVLDRAGVTGPDGPSHHGMWDLSLLQMVPGLRLAAPRDASRLAEELREAVAVDDAPTVLRFAKTAVPDDIEALTRIDGVDVLAGGGQAADVLVVGVGSMVPLALELGDELSRRGLSSTVVDPRWVLPVNPALLRMAGDHRMVVVVEDGIATSGLGARIATALAAEAMATPVHRVGLPCEFIEHASRDEILTDLGLTPGRIADDVQGRLATVEAILGSARDLGPL